MDGQSIVRADQLGQRILEGAFFFVAGDEKLLRRLPLGNWIGGTIPYFMTEQGGLESDELIYALELPAWVVGAAIWTYDETSLATIYEDIPENGFGLIAIPGSSRTHLSFALNAPRYEGFASSPLVGWITGVPLRELGRTTAKVFNGRTGAALADAAVVIHVPLPKTKKAEVGIVNIFEPSEGDALTFEEDGFAPGQVLVNGLSQPFAEYVVKTGLDIRLPLVGDFGGVPINVSFQNVDASSGEVRLYAPVFAGVVYRHAKPVGDYLRAFEDQSPGGSGDRIVFSCNCILNYVHAGLEGKKTAGISGPFTFGEVAYQLLNQTAVYLEITDTNLAERLRAETERRRQHQLLETLMDTIPDPVYVKDVAGRLIGCNKAYEMLAGLPREAILGRTVEELFTAGVARTVAEKTRDLLAHPGSQSYPLEIAATSGATRHVVVHNATFATGGGRVAGVIGVLYDVTELRRTMGEVRDLQELVPICASCKSIRDDKGYWERVETYLSRTSDARLTHGLCPPCMEKLWGVKRKDHSSG